MRRPRHLLPDERALWDMVARQITRLGPADPPMAHGIPEPAAVLPAAAFPAAALLPPKPPLPSFRLGERADHRRGNDLIAGLSEDMGRPAIRMDARAYDRLSRGKLRPEARIDLHGMTLAQAHPALVGFILSSHAAGRRLVLVITGKGRPRDDDAPMSASAGLLRRQAPHWLTLAPLAPLVLQIAPAHFSHGGGGALYVYLRRAR